MMRKFLVLVIVLFYSMANFAFDADYAQASIKPVNSR